MQLSAAKFPLYQRQCLEGYLKGKKYGDRDHPLMEVQQVDAGTATFLSYGQLYTVSFKMCLIKQIRYTVVWLEGHN